MNCENMRDREAESIPYVLVVRFVMSRRVLLRKARTEENKNETRERISNSLLASLALALDLLGAFVLVRVGGLLLLGKGPLGSLHLVDLDGLVEHLANHFLVRLGLALLRDEHLLFLLLRLLLSPPC